MLHFADDADNAKIKYEKKKEKYNASNNTKRKFREFRKWYINKNMKETGRKPVTT